MTVIFGVYFYTVSCVDGISEPLSLERLCRLAVRQHLQSVNQLDNIKDLPLPGLLKDFIEQADKISDET